MDQDDLGFEYRVLSGGQVEIKHHGRLAITLRGERADTFLSKVSKESPQAAQQRMARLTGNYRRGNERTAKNHPRNQ